MPTPTPHYRDELHELLDGRLDSATRAAVEQHLATCPACRRQLAALRATKQLAHSCFGRTEMPADLRERIQQGLRIEPAVAPEHRAASSVWRRRLRPALAAAALVAVAVGVALLVRSRQPTLPAAVERDYQAILTEQVPLELVTDEVTRLETYFSTHGIPFQTRVFDLGMMNFHLVGGRVHRLQQRPSALFVYRGPDRRLLVCQMYAGRREELPPPAARRTNNGIDFFVYRVGDRTVVFWQEGPIICALVSDADSETVIQLAFAKAMPA